MTIEDLIVALRLVQIDHGNIDVFVKDSYLGMSGNLQYDWEDSYINVEYDPDVRGVKIYH